MKYSIRGLLMLIFAVCVWTLAATKYNEAERLRNEVQQASAELESLTLKAQSIFPENLISGTPFEECMAQHDDYLSTKAARDAAVAHFPTIQQKYSTVEPAGPQTFSVRYIPRLYTGESCPIQAYKIWVPQDRPLWLKWTPTDFDSFGRPNEEWQDFFLPGPFAIRLSPGEHTIEYREGRRDGGGVDVTLALDDASLLKPMEGVAPRMESEGVIYVEPKQQTDFSPGSSVCSLFVATFKMEQDTLYALVWIDDELGTCKPFPLEEP